MTPWSRVTGRVLHYCEERVFTNLEAKRVQGFFDSDVLVGSATKVYRIIGNSVCRQVAFALGGKLAEAVRKGPQGTGTGVISDAVTSVSTESDKGKGQTVHMPSKPTKVMVLITRKISTESPGGEKRRAKWDTSAFPKDNVRVDFRFEGYNDRLEVSVTSTPRKRIRISVDEESDEDIHL
jgi:hypothetical protein